MRASSVTNLQACWSGKILVSVNSNGSVSVWNTKTLELVCEFASTIDSSGQQLAVCPRDLYIIVGAYHRHGIAAYDPLSGREIWRRKDIKRVQTLASSFNQPTVFACFSDQSAQALNIRNGETLFKKRMVRDFFDSPLETCTLIDIDRRKYEFHNAADQKVFDIKIEGCRLQSVAFAPGIFAVADHGTFVRCFSSGSGKEVWRFTPTYGSHVVSLGYNPTERMFFGLESPYAFANSTDIIALDPENGACVSRFPIRSPSTCTFINQAASLACSDGLVYEAATGKVLHRMTFVKE